MKLKLVDPEHFSLKNSAKDFDFSGDIDPIELSDSLYECMRENNGVGISANQVGIDARVFVIGWDDARINVFNPNIIEYTGRTILMDEGCLSYPGVYMKVKRPGSCQVKFQNEKGEWKDEVFWGITARIFLHEYDHMMGLTFRDKVSKLKWELAMKKLNKRIQRSKI